MSVSPPHTRYMNKGERQGTDHVEKTILSHLSPNEFCQTKLRISLT